MLLRFFRMLPVAMLLLLFAFAAVAASSRLEDAHPTLPLRGSPLTATVSPGWSNATASDLAQIATEGSPVKDKISVKWRGIATIEVYMGAQVMTSVGYIVGPMMYNMIQQTLRADCQDTHECWRKRHSFDTRYLNDHFEIGDTFVQIHVKSSYYKNMQVRNLLIGAIAAAYEESTKMIRNCYYANDPEVNYKYCNVPIQVGASTEDSHILMELTNDIADDNDGSYHCCETRESVDKRLDELMAEFKSVYPTPRSKERDVNCNKSCRHTDRESATHVDLVLIDNMNGGW